MTESRVEACIDSVMARHPGVSALAQSRYFEAVHQDLAPLARKTEIDLGLANVELERTRNGAKIMERTLEAAALRIKELEDALRPFAEDAVTWGREDEEPNNSHLYMEGTGVNGGESVFTVGDLRRAAALLEKI